MSNIFRLLSEEWPSLYCGVSIRNRGGGGESLLLLVHVHMSSTRKNQNQNPCKVIHCCVEIRTKQRRYFLFLLSGDRSQCSLLFWSIKHQGIHPSIRSFIHLIVDVISLSSHLLIGCCVARGGTKPTAASVV